MLFRRYDGFEENEDLYLFLTQNERALLWSKRNFSQIFQVSQISQEQEESQSPSSQAGDYVHDWY